jgi:chromosomal replication initiation ATPase DnaA
LRKLKPRVALEEVLMNVAKEFEVRQDQITAKGRKRNKAREVAIYLARDMCGLSCKQLGVYFGEVSGALITMMHKRISEEAAKNRKLKRRIEETKKRIFNI